MNEEVVKLVLEFAIKDEFATLSGAGRVASVDHEIGNHVVEDHIVVSAGVG